jgi:hypothetical protein
MMGIYNVSAQQLCTFDLSEDLQKNELKASCELNISNCHCYHYHWLKIMNFGTQNVQLYQFSSPTFISDEKIMFSARKMDISNPGYIDHTESIDTLKNTALFMSNFDGTKLERVRKIYNNSVMKN